MLLLNTNKKSYVLMLLVLFLMIFFPSHSISASEDISYGIVKVSETPQNATELGLLKKIHIASSLSSSEKQTKEDGLSINNEQAKNAVFYYHWLCISAIFVILISVSIILCSPKLRAKLYKK